jgi:hypothetical protein
MKRHLGVCIGFLLFVPALLHSQTAQKLEELLNSIALSNEETAWLVLEAADISRPAGISSPADAFLYASAQKWFPSRAIPEGRTRLDELSLLIMQSFNLQGGFLYMLTKNPHYAYRELAYLNILYGRIDPEMPVSGDLLLYTVNRVLSYMEGEML